MLNLDFKRFGQDTTPLDGKPVRFGLILTVDDRRVLKDYARDQGVSVSELVRALVREIRATNPTA